MADAAEEEVAAHWIDEHMEEKDITDPVNEKATAKAIFARLVEDLEKDYKNNDSKVKDLPIWFAAEIKKKAVTIHSYGNTYESLKQIADHKKVLVAWLVVRCHDVDQTLRTKIMKVSFKGQGLGVKGRALFTQADAFARESEIAMALEENLFVSGEDYEFSGRSIEALCKEIKKNAGAHGAKNFYFGADETYKFSD